MSKLDSTRPTCPKGSSATGSAAGDDSGDSTITGVTRRPRSPIGNAQERRVFRDRGLRHVEKGLTSPASWKQLLDAAIDAFLRQVADPR